MRNYLDLMIKCRDEGIDIFNSRTNITCRTLIGAQVEFDLSSGLFPAVTTKKLAFKGVKGELLGFFRGYTSAADFRALGCNVWNQNANETPAWLDNPFRKGEDDLGPIYGKQWTEWDNYYEVSGEDEDTAIHLEEYGYILAARKIDPFLANKDVLIYKKTINQLEVALRTIITNPSDRRIIVTGWNPGDIDKVALPACHMDYRFIPANGILNVVMTIR
jgi:thymidylate synthase